MHIDGKNITRLNQATNVSKTNSSQNKTTHAAKADLHQASEYALNQSGIDPQFRLANDEITNLQSRQKALQHASDRLASAVSGQGQDGEAKAIANEIQNSGEFAGTSLTERLNELVTTESPLGNSIQEAIQTEISDISKQLDKHTDDESEFRVEAPSKHIREFQERLRENPHLLGTAHSGLNADSVNGLLGNS